jgi:hypothetical protein
MRANAKRSEVTLTINDNAPDAWVESVEITTTIPHSYAQLLIQDDSVCAALEKDLKRFLEGKWVEQASQEPDKEAKAG